MKCSLVLGAIAALGTQSPDAERTLMWVDGAEVHSSISNLTKIVFRPTKFKDVFVSANGEVGVDTGGEVTGPVRVIFTQSYPRARKLVVKRQLMKLCLEFPDHRVFPFSRIPQELQQELRRVEFSKHPGFVITDSTGFAANCNVRTRLSSRGKSFEVSKGFGSVSDRDGWALTRQGMQAVTLPGLLAQRTQAGLQMRPSSEFVVSPGVIRGSRNLESHLMRAMIAVDPFYQAENEKIAAEFQEALSKRNDWAAKQFMIMLDARRSNSFQDYSVMAPTSAKELYKFLTDDQEELGPEVGYKIKDMLGQGDMESTLTFSLEYREKTDEPKQPRKKRNASMLFQFTVSD